MNYKRKRRKKSRQGKNRQKVLHRNFGTNEYGFADLPIKISGITLRRLENDMGCSYCFPHGHENHNATNNKFFHDASWKHYRPTQWKLPGELSHYGYQEFTPDAYRCGYWMHWWEMRLPKYNGYSKMWKRKKGKWKPPQEELEWLKKKNRS